MKDLRFFACLCVTFLFITASSPALALADRVFVSARSGTDVLTRGLTNRGISYDNPCDNINSPCQTFKWAVTQLNPNGEVIVLDSGDYGPPVTINRAVTINAPNGVVAYIHPASGDAITINAGATDTVILRGLTLSGGTNNGITVNRVGQLFVERCTITGFANYGVWFSVAGGTLFMRDDDVRNCVWGVYVTSGGSGPAAHAAIRDSAFANNHNAAVVADAGGFVSVTDSEAAGNGTGFAAFSNNSAAQPTFMMLMRVQAVSNTVGLMQTACCGATSTLRFAYSLVTQNSFGVLETIVAGVGPVIGSSPGTSIVAGNGTDFTEPLGPAMNLY